METEALDPAGVALTFTKFYTNFEESTGFEADCGPRTYTVTDSAGADVSSFLTIDSPNRIITL